MADDRGGSLSGLTESEAKAFHSAMIQGTLGFVVVTLIAHTLIWFWRPWF